MSRPINDIIYEKVLEDEGFIDSLWNQFDQTTKIEILQKSGIDIMEEYIKIYGRDEDNQSQEKLDQ